MSESPVPIDTGSESLVKTFVEYARLEWRLYWAAVDACSDKDIDPGFCRMPMPIASKEMRDIWGNMAQCGRMRMTELTPKVAAARKRLCSMVFGG